MSRRVTEDESFDSLSDSDEQEASAKQSKSKKPKRKARHAVFCQNPANYVYTPPNQYSQFPPLPIIPIGAVPHAVPNRLFVSPPAMQLEPPIEVQYGARTVEPLTGCAMHAGVPPLTSCNVHLPPTKCEIFLRHGTM